MKQDDTFTVDGAYIKAQARFVMVKYFAPFNPAYYRAIGKVEGVVNKFWTAVYWPESCPD